jgi:choline kinase
MKAIVLSAGQGKRLLPYTARQPKCLLSVDGERTMLEVQLRALARCGVERATVLVGFGASKVDRFVATTPIPGLVVETLYNPFYALSDNLATCWVARHGMDSDFVLLNGDTIFEDRVLRRLLEGPSSPITVTIDHKESYDDDDMKVSVDEEGRLLAIGKTLKPEIVNGESIGMLCFRGSGPKYFRGVIERTMREPEALKRWYLSVVNEIAQDTTVDTASIRGLWWREIDEPTDLEEARRSFPTQPDRPAARLSAVGKGS